MTFGVLSGALGRSVVTRPRLLGFVAVGLLGIVIAVATSGNFFLDRVSVAATFVDIFGLTLLIPVAAMVFGTASLGDPIEDGTYVYLWLRPIRRGLITLAAYVVTASTVLVVAVVPTVASAAIIEPAPEVVVGATVAAAAAALAYSAVFVLMGHLTSRALAWGVGYLLIWEQFVSRGGRGLGALSVHSHAASLLAGIADTEVNLDYFGVGGAVFGIVILTTGALAWSLRRQTTMDVA